MNKEQKLNIRQFKLVNGEEIIAHVMQKDPTSYVIERPLRVLSNFIGGFSFQRWFPFSSQKLYKIPNSRIVYHVEIDDQIKHEYVKAASGLPDPKLNLRSDEDMELAMEELQEMLEASQVESDPEPDLISWSAEDKGKKILH